MSPCPVCQYASEHGSWPRDFRGTHCGLDHRGPSYDCHRSWTGFKESHCAECHLHFSTDKLAEKHRKGDRCMTASELLRLRTEVGKPIFRVCETAKGEIWRNHAVMELKPVFAK